MMEPFLGEVSLFPYEFDVEGWARCEGQVLPIKDRTALFSLLGTRFGGDGRSNFGLPKMAPLATSEGAALAYFIAIEGMYPRRR